MDIIVYADKNTWLHQIDPRIRIIAACGLSLVLSMSQSGAALLAGLAIGFLAVIAGRVPIVALLQRLVPLNALLFLLMVVLLFFTPGEPLFRVGPAVATHAGFHQGVVIGLKANAIVLLLAALLGTIELVKLGHALARLGVPPKLAHLLLFTVRYLGLMLSEYDRLSRAAQLRGFAAGPNRHTLRTTGYMVGMILVRSYARGERIRDAMRLRGYQGAIAFHGDLALTRADAGFALLSGIAFVLILGLGF